MKSSGLMPSKTRVLEDPLLRNRQRVFQDRTDAGRRLAAFKVFKSIAEGGFRRADIVQIGADNEKMLRELRDLGVDFYKRHRIYRQII